MSITLEFSEFEARALLGVGSIQRIGRLVRSRAPLRKLDHDELLSAIGLLEGRLVQLKGELERRDCARGAP